jgi:hypothetical protein
MATSNNTPKESNNPKMSLDTWAVAAALLAALLIRIGVIHRIPW